MMSTDFTHFATYFCTFLQGILPKKPTTVASGFLCSNYTTKRAPCQQLWRKKSIFVHPRQNRHSCFVQFVNIGRVPPFFLSGQYLLPNGVICNIICKKSMFFTICFLALYTLFTLGKGKSKNRIDISPQVCYNVCIPRRIYNHIDENLFFFDNFFVSPPIS